LNLAQMTQCAVLSWAASPVVPSARLSRHVQTRDDRHQPNHSTTHDCSLRVASVRRNYEISNRVTQLNELKYSEKNHIQKIPDLIATIVDNRKHR
jgi:hypothetical protein